MANNVLEGIELIDGTVNGFSLSNLSNSNKMYFVRTDENGENGYIYFNKKKYGISDIGSINCGEYQGE